MSLAAPIFSQSADGPFRADSALVTDHVPSPNHGERRGRFGAGNRPEIIILHYTGMPAGRGLTASERAIRWLTTPASEVSCHYVIDEDGRIFQLVAENRRAWHAGLGAWRGDKDINSASIGVEIVNPGHTWDMSAAPFTDAESVEVHPGYSEFPDAQIEAVIALTADIIARNKMSVTNVLAHSDIAPGRKRDPGERFPWHRLAVAGYGAWVETAPIVEGPTLKAGDEGQPVRAIQSMLALLGYEIALTGVFDSATTSVISAFQRHWRPAKIDGVADRSTVMTLNALLKTLPEGGRA